MAQATELSTKEARKRLLGAYTVRDPGGFTEMAKRPFLNPIEQLDSKNKRKLHPLFVIGAALFLVAIAAFFFLRH